MRPRSLRHLLGSPRAVLAGAGVLHAALLAYFVDPRLLRPNEPVISYDYALHFYQVRRAVETLRTWGEGFSYDPFVLAGQPAGAVEDLTSKSAELFVLAASTLGAPLAAAFNLYVLLVHLGLPLAGYAAARLFRLRASAAAWVAVLWVVLWHFDSFLHWCWYVGMISWGAASYLAVVVVGLTYRALSQRTAGAYTALALFAAALALIHPFAVMTVVPAVAVMYARDFPRLKRRDHAALWGGALLAASTTLTWIGPALLFRHYIGEVNAFLRPTLSYVVLDYFDLMKDVLMTGQPVRTAFRMLCFVCAFSMIVRWQRRSDDRALVLGVFIGTTVAFAYLAGYEWHLRQTQPYRQIGPAILAAAIAAVALLEEAFEDTARVPWTSTGKALATVGIIAATPRLASTVLQYLPTGLPSRHGPAGIAPYLPVHEPGLVVMGHAAAPEPYRKIKTLLESQPADGGRAVVLDWVLGEYLAATTARPILGGIPQRNVPHADAHPLRQNLVPLGPGDDPLERYFITYAASHFVTMGPPTPLEERTDLFEPPIVFGAYRVYELKSKPSYFAEGSGHVDQSLNLLRVTRARGKRVVLRFHWMETLRCRPGCTVDRVAVPGDRVGFIGVSSPPASFEIYNEYPRAPWAGHRSPSTTMD